MCTVFGRRIRIHDIVKKRVDNNEYDGQGLLFVAPDSYAQKHS